MHFFIPVSNFGTFLTIISCFSIYPKTSGVYIHLKVSSLSKSFSTASLWCIQTYKTFNKLDLSIREPTQIYIHRKDNSPKPVNHRLTLKEGPKVKSDIRRFPAHNILQVGFTLQTSRTNNKRVINPFKFGCPLLTLKEGLKVKSDHIRRFPVHDFI